MAALQRPAANGKPGKKSCTSIPSTMRAMQVGSSAFGRPFRCILLSASRSAAQTTVAVLAGTQAGSNPDIREVEDEGS